MQCTLTGKPFLKSLNNSRAFYSFFITKVFYCSFYIHHASVFFQKPSLWKFFDSEAFWMPSLAVPGFPLFFWEIYFKKVGFETVGNDLSSTLHRALYGGIVVGSRLQENVCRRFALDLSLLYFSIRFINSSLVPYTASPYLLAILLLLLY